MTDQSDNGSGKITYTVRELLGELKTMVLAIDAKLDNKADRASLDGLASRVQSLETFGSPNLQREMDELRSLKGQVLEIEKDSVKIKDLDVRLKEIEANDLEFGVQYIAPEARKLVPEIIRWYQNNKDLKLQRKVWWEDWWVRIGIAGTLIWEFLNIIQNNAGSIHRIIGI